MRRREFLVGLGGLGMSPSASIRAQTRRGPSLIGILSPSAPEMEARLYRPFRDALQGLGFVEGNNVRFEFRYANGVLSRLPELAGELVKLKPDLIIAGSTAGTLAAHNATDTIPVVMITVVDPVAIGVVKSIAHPGGNITGVWTFGGADALIGKRINLLKEIVPGLARMGVLTVAGDPTSKVLLRLLPSATRSLDISYNVYEIRSIADLENMFLRAASDGMEALFIDQSPFFVTHRTETGALAARVRLPAIYGYREHAEAGGLISYGSSLPDAYRQVARLAGKILQGAKPSELPVEQADKFELVVNNGTAKALGLKIPEAFLLRADEVIE